MQRQEAPLADNVAVEIDINIGLLSEVLGDPRLPVARIDEIDNAQRDIIDMFLIVFTKQPQRLGTPRRQWISRSDVLRGGINPHRPAAKQQPAAQQPGEKRWAHQAEIKQQESGDDQDRFAQTIRAAQGVFFRRFRRMFSSSTCSLSSPRMEAWVPRRVPARSLALLR
jgi:hypothetical protein